MRGWPVQVAMIVVVVAGRVVGKGGMRFRCVWSRVLAGEVQVRIATGGMVLAGGRLCWSVEVSSSNVKWIGRFCDQFWQWECIS